MSETIAHRADSPPMSEADQAAFFAETLTRARQAEARTGAHERFIRVADATVRLVFAGDALERALYPALAHLSVEATATPDATFHVWDTASRHPRRRADVTATPTAATSGAWQASGTAARFIGRSSR
jgi:hypothetical protein